MIHKTIAVSYEQARRRAEISKVRYEYAKMDPSKFTNEDMEQLKQEMYDDEMDLQGLRDQLKADISEIQNALIRRVAEDHYLNGFTVKELAKLYSFSSSSIKRFLRIARCSD